MSAAPQPDPVPLTKAARALCVPPRWLRDEILSGRLPGLKAGKEILVHVPQVRAFLARRAQLEWEPRR